MVFALLLRSQQLAERFGLLAGRVASRLLGLVRRPPVHGWELATVRFRTRTLELLEHGWVPITAATLISHLSLYLVLLACLRAVGVSDAEVSWVQVLVAFAFMRLATIVPPPAARGGGAGADRAAGGRRWRPGAGDRRGAGVPGADLGLQIPVGVACYLWWRRSQRRTQPATPAGAPQVAAPKAAGAADTDRSAIHASDHQPQAPPRAYVRHPSDVLRVVLGLLILLATMPVIHQHRVGVREANLFRLINDLALPSWTRWPVWGVMQLGVIGAVLPVAGLALLTRRIRLAAYAALAGGTIYLIAKLVKEFVQRGRPQTLLADVYIFDMPDRGLGYVSGHSAVAVALATVASPFLGRRARRVAWTLAALVCVARIYVGSHLPLDVVGGRPRVGRRRPGAAGVRRPHRPPVAGAGPHRPADLWVRPGRPGTHARTGSPLGPLPGLQPLPPRPVRQDRDPGASRQRPGVPGLVLAAPSWPAPIPAGGCGRPGRT